MTPSAFARGILAVAAAVSALTTVSCKQKLLCPEMDTCGGDIKGDWVLSSKVRGDSASCSEELFLPTPDPRLSLAELPAARLPPPEPALFDWCQLLATGPGDIIAKNPPQLYWQLAPVGSTTLHLDGVGGYKLSTTRTGKFTIDYPPFCVRATGAVDNATGNVCQQLQTGLRMKTSGRYRNITCELNPDDPPATAGCLCGIDVYEVQDSAGVAVPQGDGTIVFLPGNNFPETATYCAQANRLQLTGADNEYLFDRTGLRTLDLVRLPTAPDCTNGIQDELGEDGIDCGPLCAVNCTAVNCSDMMQGPGEDGVDCGRRCPAKPTCTPAAPPAP